MNRKKLQEAARRQPFEPFRVILITGAVFDIRHPDLIMVGDRSAILGIPQQPSATVYGTTIKVELLHIMGIEELPVNPPSQNGPSG
jgi:hypothetical protein